MKIPEHINQAIDDLVGDSDFKVLGEYRAYQVGDTEAEKVFRAEKKHDLDAGGDYVSTYESKLFLDNEEWVIGFSFGDL